MVGTVVEGERDSVAVLGVFIADVPTWILRNSPVSLLVGPNPGKLLVGSEDGSEPFRSVRREAAKTSNLSLLMHL